MFSAILVLISSFLIAYLITPAIIHLAIKKNLYANTNTNPVLQGTSKRQISNLGGIAIFVALRITHSIFIHISDFPVNYYIAALFIIFLVGLNDDLTGVRPISRLLAQCIVALIMIYPGGLQLNAVSQLLGLQGLDAVITLVFIVGLINAYNLIDGIDGLAGSLGALGAFSFAYLFYLSGDMPLALLCLSLFGALLAFLFYNISPARIFMGDSGAYIIGFTFAILSIKLVNELQATPVQLLGISLHTAYGIVASIVMIPVFDTLRVFVLRIYRRSHPFQGDNNHIHHRLLNMGFTHTQTTLLLSCTTLVVFLISLTLQSLSPLLQIATLFGITFILNVSTYVLYQKKRKLITN